MLRENRVMHEIADSTSAKLLYKQKMFRLTYYEQQILSKRAPGFAEPTLNDGRLLQKTGDVRLVHNIP